nr:MAG: ORF1 [TTV-like mini virus]
MPWRRRWRWRRPYKWRRYTYRRRRPRKTLWRRRFYRKVRYHRKLKRLTIRQWQPNKIKLCKMKGLLCLFLCNKYRLGKNLALYNQSIVPKYLPGGGGFSIFQFTLENLYTMHQYCRNWWTTSNAKLPLVRYLKCVLKIYQAEDVDIVFRYSNHPPFESTQLTYPTVQPSILMMLKNTLLIPSKKTYKMKKPYRKLTISPPKLMTNKWFFQQDLGPKPLLTTQTVAASFDHYYIGTDKMSNNCEVPTLNTILIQNLNFTHKPYYHIRTDGTQKVYLFATHEHVEREKQPKSGQVILLADSQNYKAGWTYEDYQRWTHVQSPTKGFQDYKNHISLYAGNPFYKDYIDPTQEAYHQITLFQWRGQDDPSEALGSSENENTKNLVQIYNPLVYFLRYNPNTDKGNTNSTYLLQNFKDKNGWEKPTDHKLILEGFPLWINWWGFIDFQKAQHILPNIDTHTIFVTQTDTIHGAPTKLPAIVPLDDDFIHGKSPFEPDINELDKTRWYPMVQYQESAINNLLSTGPGVAKLNGKNTVEAKCKYCFYFKFGGNPPAMVDVTDPTEQPKFPIPSNFIETNSLQDPTTPAELYLYNFDQRRQFLTKAATTRISKDYQTKQLMFADGTTTPGPPAILRQTSQTSEDETSDSEKEEEEILQQLLKQRKKQQKLKLRIKQLMDQIPK